MSDETPVPQRPRDLADEGLIPASERMTAELPPRPVAIGVIVLFLASLVSTALVDLVHPAPIPKLFGAEKVEDSRIRKSAKIADGSAARLLEHDLRLTSSVRATLSEPFAICLYRFLHEAGEEVIAGRDGWLFLRRRAELEPNPGRMLRLTAMLSALDRRLASNGVQLVVAPIPRKAVVCSQFLPARIDPHAEIEADFVADLLGRGIRTAQVGQAFAREDSAGLYFPGDGHWTERAEVLAAEETMRAAGLLVPEGERVTRLVPDGSKKPEGNTFFFFGIDPDSAALDFLPRSLVPCFDVRAPGGGPPVLQGPQRIALVGTSFSARRRFPHYLEYFSQTPVLNGALVGEMPLEQLARVRGMEPWRDIRTLVVEMPLHTTSTEKQFTGVFDFFGLLAPARQLVLELPVPLTLAPEVGGRTLELGREFQPLAVCARGRFVHSGDGALALRVRGRATGKRVKLRLSASPRIGLDCGWPPEERELVLPIVNGEASSDAIRLLAGGVGKLRVESLELIVEAGRYLLQESVGTSQRELLEQGGWQEGIALACEEPLPPRSTLIVQLNPRTNPEGVVWVELRTAGEWREVLRGVPAPGAILAANLGCLTGRRVEAVRLRGPGLQPRSLLQRVSILAPE